MAARPPLSRGEMEVARVLWQLKQATVRQVHESFPASRKIDFVTVQTYLRRLEAKGYVQGAIRGRIRVYRPKVKPRTVIGEALDDLIERLFGGETMPLMRHLLSEKRISDHEVAELRRLIERLDEESSGGHER